MKVKIILSLIILLVTESIFSQNIYVSPDGNDNNDGTENSPFKTLGRARKKVLEYNGVNINSPINVYLKGGTYELGETFKLSIEDSGTDSFKVTYQNYNNEKVIISGGKKLKDLIWTPYSSKIYKTYINNSFFGSSDSIPIDTINKRKEFRQLYVNNVKAKKARDSIYSPTKITLDEVNFDSYIIKNGSEISSNLKSKNIELITQLEWKEIRIPIDSLNGQKLYIDNSNNFTALLSNFRDPKFYREVKIIENDLSFLNEAGEWYFDPNTNWLYYYPLEGQNIDKIEITIPFIETLISGDEVQNITFKGLTFSHATWYQPNEGYFHRQLDQYGIWKNANIKYVQGLSNIDFIRSSNITFENNNFINLGGTGLSFNDGSNNNLIINNTFKSIASNAISIGPDEVFPLNGSNICKGNRIGEYGKGNTISNIADEYHGSVGIYIGNTANTIITDNIISNLPYSGIITGWINESGLPGGHIIRRNKIDNVLNILNDGGGIYNFGELKNSHNNGLATEISNNEININNIDSLLRCAIYLDQLTSNIKVINNIGISINKYRRHYMNNGFQDEDMHIYNNIKQRSREEEENITIENNTFGASSLWIERNNYNLRRNQYVTEIPSFSKDGIGDLGVRFVDVDHDGYKDLVVNRYIASGNNFKVAILNTKERLGWRKNLDLGDNQTTIIDEPQYHTPFPVSQDGIVDLGSRFVDIDGDGFKDYVRFRHRNGILVDSINDVAVYLNTEPTGSSTIEGRWWQKDSRYNLPYPIADDFIGDLGCRFVDIDGDGDKDILLNRYKSQNLQHKAVYINQNPGWRKITLNDTINNEHLFIPPYHTAVDGIDDIGVRFMDFDGDCDDDMLVHRYINSESSIMLAYENTGNGWNRVFGYVPPVPISKEGKDNGVRFIDINHDGLKDFVISNENEKNVWLNKCDGWETHPITDTKHNYSKPPINFVDEGLNDNGVRIVDIDGDGFEDIIQKRTKINGETVIRYFQNRNPQTSSIYCNTNCSSKSKSVISKRENDNANSSSDIITIYPNPTNGIVNFKLKNISFLDIKIYNLTGTLLKSISDKEKSSYKIDLSNYPNGIYFCVITNNGSTYNRKIIKQ